MNDGFIQIGVIGMRDPATGRFLDEGIPIYFKGQADPGTEARTDKLLGDMILERLCKEYGRSGQAEEAVT